VTARRLITPAFDNLVSTAHSKGEYDMPGTSYDQNSATLAELLSDPIVQMAMGADHVTEQQLMSLISDTLSKLTAGSQSGSEGNTKPSPGIARLGRASSFAIQAMFPAEFRFQITAGARFCVSASLTRSRARPAARVVSRRQARPGVRESRNFAARLRPPGGSRPRQGPRQDKGSP
jgi:hypothetical protein